MWRLNPLRCTMMEPEEPEEYVDSVRLRLGCAGLANPCFARPARPGLLTRARHTQPLRGRRGHARTQRDCTAEMEVLGRIRGTDLRPADVLTSALDNSHTALEILIRSLLSRLAPDCTQTDTRSNVRTMSHIWKRSAWQIRACWPLAAFRDSLHFEIQVPAWGPGPCHPCGFLSSCPVRSVFLVRVPQEARHALMSVLSRFARLVSSLGHVPGQVPWPLSGPPWRPWKPLLRMVSRLFRRRHWSPWTRSPPRVLPLASHTFVPARGPGPPSPGPLSVALVAPSWSTSAAPRAFPSRALSCSVSSCRHWLSRGPAARSPLAATPTPRPC